MEELRESYGEKVRNYVTPISLLIEYVDEYIGGTVKDEHVFKDLMTNLFLPQARKSIEKLVEFSGNEIMESNFIEDNNKG